MENQLLTSMTVRFCSLIASFDPESTHYKGLKIVFVRTDKSFATVYLNMHKFLKYSKYSCFLTLLVNLQKIKQRTHTVLEIF